MFEHTLIFSSIVEENLLLTHLLESTYIYLYSNLQKYSWFSFLNILEGLGLGQ